MADTDQTPLGLTLPIRMGNRGYFDQNYDTFSQVRTNIINLLRTKPGERRMSPMFGSRIHTMVFEPNTEILPAIIENIIKEDVSNWITGAQVIDVAVRVSKSNESTESLDIYRLDIQVQFRVTLTGQVDVIQISIDKGLI